MKAPLMLDETRLGGAAGPVARTALRTAAIYVSLVVWHFLFFHQLVLVASLYAIVTLAPACTHVLAFLAVGYMYFYFDRSELSGKRRWEWFLTSWITDALTDYFPMRLVRTQGTHTAHTRERTVADVRRTMELESVSVSMA